MDLKKRLQNEWTELEDEYCRLHSMQMELDEFSEFEDGNIKTTAAYMLIDQRMKDIVKQQQLYERLGILA